MRRIFFQTIGTGKIFSSLDSAALKKFLPENQGFTMRVKKVSQKIRSGIAFAKSAATQLLITTL
jgi:hypothetical protein